MFSLDYRAAVAAEASGDLALAAERYALAGRFKEAAKMHLALANRAENHVEEIAALRNALHWVPEDERELQKQISGSLGQVLLARCRSEGIATALDSRKVDEAATLLANAERWLEAGSAWEQIGNREAAAKAFEQGGHIQQLEDLLENEQKKRDQARRIREAYSDYELHLRTGDRAAAHHHLKQCAAAATNKGRYRSLLAKLETQRITTGKITMRFPNKQITLVGAKMVVLGRDTCADLVIRGRGVSRRHAKIQIGPPDATPRFHLQDAGSRNGTTIAEMAITGTIPLVADGLFGLGDQVTIAFAVDCTQLILRNHTGIDDTFLFIVTGVNEPIVLNDYGIPGAIAFVDGRPQLSGEPASVTVNSQPLPLGGFQLIHGDRIQSEGLEVEVL